MKTEAEKMYWLSRESWTAGQKAFDWEFPTVEKFALRFAFDNRQPGEKMTPREEYQAKFGPIDDENWQWLKEFLIRNVQCDKVHVEDL